jgi:hypothetical protein
LDFKTIVGQPLFELADLTLGPATAVIVLRQAASQVAIKLNRMAMTMPVKVAGND